MYEGSISVDPFRVCSQCGSIFGLKCSSVKKNWTFMNPICLNKLRPEIWRNIGWGSQKQDMTEVRRTEQTLASMNYVRLGPTKMLHQISPPLLVDPLGPLKWCQAEDLESKVALFEECLGILIFGRFFIEIYFTYQNRSNFNILLHSMSPQKFKISEILHYLRRNKIIDFLLPKLSRFLKIWGVKCFLGWYN